MKKVFVCILVLLLCLTAFVACNDNKTTGPSEELEAAKQTVNAQYKDAATSTPADYEVMSAVIGKGKTFQIEWTVSVTQGDPDSVVVKNEEGKVIIDIVPERPEAEIKYDLSARIYADGEEATLTFKRTVPQWRELSFEEYVAAEDDSAVVVKGIITGIVAKSKGATNNCLYVNDETNGGYYVYQLTQDPVTDLNLAIGMEIRMIGIKDTYNGTLEVTKTTIEVINATPVAVQPVDFTQKFIDAANTKAEELVGPQAMLVTLKGATLTSAGDNGYYNFTLGGKSTYIRISSSTCPLSTADQNTFKNAFNEHIGYQADITGVICVYGGAFYLTPVDTNAFTNFTLPDLDDAGKVAFVKDLLTINSSYTSNFSLPLTGLYDTTITWAEKEDSAAIEIAADGKVTVSPSLTEDLTATIVATIVSGDASATKEFTITIPRIAEVTVAEFLAKDTADTSVYAIVGWITAANANPGTTGSFVLEDATGAVFSYNKADVTVGDKVKVTGTRSVNSGVDQIATISVEKLEAEEHDLVVKKEVNASEIDLATINATTIAEYTGQYLKISGVKLVLSGTYLNGNKTTDNSQVLSLFMNNALKDAAGELTNQEVYVYGYCRGFSSGKYVSIQVTKIEAVNPLTDAQKIANAKAALSVSENAVANFELQTSHYSVAISWASDNAAIAIDGANATVTRGTEDVVVNLTATLSLNETTDTATFRVTVKAEVIGATETESVLAFTDLAARTSQTDDTQVWTNGVVTFTNNKSASTSNINGSYYNPVRCYKGSDIIIDCTGMTKIVVECNTAAYATALAGCTITGGTATVDGANVTITVTGTSVSITNLGAQVRINSITVTYLG